MEIKTFRAATLQEALSMVRRELGPEAAVLQTRDVGAAGWWGWLSGRPRVEVTASLDVNVPSRLPPREPARTAPVPAAPMARAAIAASARPAPVAPASEATPPYRDEMKGQLDELQAMVEDLCRRTRGRGFNDLPENLFRLYAELIDAEVHEDLARELVERVQREVHPGELDDPVLLKARIARLVEEEIQVCGSIRTQPGKCRVVALVGPTGVGKTTTIAKLAANFRLRDKQRVALITVDTYRIAAVEQLRTYADIIDLPMQVVSTPREMREAVRALAGFDLVLIDTAGRSPKDDVKIQELKAFLAEAQADEVHLVLASVASSGVLQRTAKEFAAVGATSLILTKLDEASGLGNLLPLLRSSHLPLSYLTDGQNVPDDIAPADARRLTRLVLGTPATALA